METPSDAGATMARSLDATARAITDGVKAVLADVGPVAREEHRLTAVLGPGGDRLYSNFARAGALTIKVRKTEDAVAVIPVGPWGIAEHGARPHTMKAWGRGTAHHPGTRSTQGKRAWSRAEEATLTRLDRQIPAVMDRTVTKAFENG